MPTFTFTVEIQGTGYTQEEAWIDAVDSFAGDPGDPLEVEEAYEDDFDDLSPDDDTDTLEFSDDR